MLDSYVRDRGLQKVILELQQNPKSHKKICWDQGQLKRKGKIVVGNDVTLQIEILNLFHASGLGGHSGVHATYQRIATILYWKRLWKSVRDFVRTCQVCQ